MSFLTCVNCLYLFGDTQSRCPMCGADHEGDRAEYAFDAETRTAVQALGGLFGGILEGPEADTLLLWCSHGVVMEDRGTGYRWKARVSASIEDIRVPDDAVELVFPGATLRLNPEDGTELEPCENPRR